MKYADGGNQVDIMSRSVQYIASECDIYYFNIDVQQNKG
jgi:hypothetical protein